jgi:hypothetical protein
MKQRSSLSLALRFLSIAAGAFLSSAAIASDAPLVTANVTTITTAKQILDAPDPLEVDFRVTVSNRADRAVTLTRVEVFTDDDSGFTLQDGEKDTRLVIPPDNMRDITLKAQSLVPDGLQHTEALQVRVRLTFDDSKGKFIKEFSQFIP